MPRDSLARLAELELRYDGPIPDALREEARLGSAEAVERLFATGQAAFLRSLIRGQIALIRRRRSDGTAYPALIRDLLLYRSEWRAWQRRCRALRDSETPPS
jgi:hypothetical protein